MATPTYTALATTTLASSASTVTFSSIPSTYRDLVVVINVKATVGTAYPSMQFNSDTAANYYRVGMSGTSSGITSFAGNVTRVNFGGYSAASTDFGYNAIAHIIDYSATDKHKTTLARSNQASSNVDAIAVRWASTSAVNSITFRLDAGSYDVGTTLSLYGIEA